MNNAHKPYIPADQKLSELSVKGILLGLILALILAISNTFLALKIGVLTASSIPAAIISMGLLRFFRNSNILENNLVQTCASAGEAIAGGIVYTAPALIIIHYWLEFNYLQTFVIAIIGGVLGVLFTIPLRRVFMNEPQLRFPEGTAIAEVLKANVENATNTIRLLIGSGLGAAIELCQTGFKVLATNLQFWLQKGNIVTGFGLGFSATLIGAGYLMGFEVGLSILLGTIIANVFCMAVLSHVYTATMHTSSSSEIAAFILSEKIRYVGIGAMLISGLATLFMLIKPFYQSIASSMQGLFQLKTLTRIPRTERDLPLSMVLIGIVLMLILSYVLFNLIFDFQLTPITTLLQPVYMASALAYILFFGFIFSTICGYFSGLVGVTASPGSSVAIAAVFIAALLLKFFLSLNGSLNVNAIHEAEAITIVLASIVMGSACVANNNSQDLKVGHIVGATPWKQQLMLLLGALVAALIIPVIMQLLFSVYGIAGVMPDMGMNPDLSLPAPPAAAMAAISQGVFSGDLPWSMLQLGAGIALVAIALSPLLKRVGFKLSFIGLAIGIYLPLASTTPLFIGALIHHFASKRGYTQHGIMIACGLVAGAAIMNVILAIPFSLMHNPDGLRLLPVRFTGLSEILALITTVVLCVYLYKGKKTA